MAALTVLGIEVSELKGNWWTEMIRAPLARGLHDERLGRAPRGQKLVSASQFSAAQNGRQNDDAVTITLPPPGYFGSPQHPHRQKPIKSCGYIACLGVESVRKTLAILLSEVIIVR